MKPPNFFIIGAQKCGTTSLWSILKEHPQCFMPDFKEPSYFSTDLIPIDKVDSWEKYIQLFEEGTDEHLAVGESSTTYLMSQEAISNIYEFDPNAKLIAMLRNPVDLVYSYHLFRVYLGQEHVHNFEKVWQLQDDRKNGKNLPKTKQTPVMWYYPEVARLGNHVERLLTVFPRDQVKFILTEDFAKDSRKVYNETLSFLGLPHDGRSDFSRSNTFKTKKSFILSKLWIKVHVTLMPLITFFKKIFRIDRLGIRKKFDKWNSVSGKKDPMTPEMREVVLEEFREDINKLSNILDRDLSHWLK